MRVADRIFGLALRTLPRRLRRSLGREMRETFRRRLAHHRRRAGVGAAAWYAVRAVADVVRTGLAERRRGRSGARDGAMVTRTGRVGGGEMTTEIWLEMKVAVRRLAGSPGFAAAAVAVLALGIGANAAIFSAVKAALLTPPPYPAPERLVLVELTDSSTVRPGTARPIPWSYPKYRALADAEGLPLDGLAAYAVRPLTLSGREGAERVSAEVVTPGYMDVLGLEPLRGRDFGPADDGPGAEPVALLSHALWENRFGGDPGVVGRSVRLSGHAVTVVGVAPPDFDGLSGRADLWLPVHAAARILAPFLVDAAQAHWLQAVGRLAPGAALDELRGRMAGVGASVGEGFPNADPTSIQGGDARSLVEARRHPQARRSLLVLGSAAALLLLVACANLAGLLLARARDRDRDTAVRRALGAGRWRAARGFLVESLLLSLIGGLLAVGVAHGGVDLLVAAWPDRFLEGGWNLRAVDLDRIRVDGPVLGVAFALAVGTGLLFGAVPALSASRRDPGRRLREGPAGALGRPGGGPDPRGALVAGQTALTLILVVGAGLLLRSLGELRAVDRGYDVDRLLVFQYELPRDSRWSEDATAFHREYLERLRGLPGVESAALGSAAPMGGHWTITRVRRAGGTSYAEGTEPSIGVHYVSPGYFSTLGVEIRGGRALRSDDGPDAPPVVVLGASAARELFPDGDAVGQRVNMGVGLTPAESEGAEVVGVVEDVLYDGPERGVMPEAYIALAQDPARSARAFLRTRGEPLALVGPARRALAEIAPDIPLFRARSLAQLEAAATADTRALGVLLAIFAGLALLLAATGIWALVAYAVSRRTREIGLRIALGAEPRAVVATVLRRGAALALAGIALGAGGAWALSRVFESLLYGVRPTDPASFLGGAAVLLAVSIVAAWLPARRSTRVDPMRALRAE